MEKIENIINTGNNQFPDLFLSFHSLKWKKSQKNVIKEYPEHVPPYPEQSVPPYPEHVPPYPEHDPPSRRLMFHNNRDNLFHPRRNMFRRIRNMFTVGIAPGSVDNLY
jgi:hypothetical protein